MAKHEVEADLQRFAKGERVHVDLAKRLRTLPADVDVALAAKAVAKLVSNTFYFGRNCKQLPAAVIRAVLAGDDDSPTQMFLRLAVDADGSDHEVVARWQRALAALLDLDLTYAWGSKQRRTKIRGLAEDPVILAAIQGTVANSPKVRLDMLAVLAADGSEASVDALIPHLDVDTAGVADRLELLTRLQTHARRTPTLDALFAEIDTALDDRSARSAALGLGPLIGLGKTAPLWFNVTFSGTQRDYAVQGNLVVDSRKLRWYSVSIHGRNFTSFDSTGEVTDHLKLGHCDIAEVPDWLDRSATKLKLETKRGRRWEVSYLRTHLRGAKRDRIAAWLFG